MQTLLWSFFPRAVATIAVAIEDVGHRNYKSADILPLFGHAVQTPYIYPLSMSEL